MFKKPCSLMVHPGQLPNRQNEFDTKQQYFLSLISVYNKNKASILKTHPEGCMSAALRSVPHLPPLVDTADAFKPLPKHALFYLVIKTFALRCKVESKWQRHCCTSGSIIYSQCLTPAFNPSFTSRVSVLSLIGSITTTPQQERSVRHMALYGRCSE